MILGNWQVRGDMQFRGEIHHLELHDKTLTITQTADVINDLHRAYVTLLLHDFHLSSTNVESSITGWFRCWYLDGQVLARLPNRNGGRARQVLHQLQPRPLQARRVGLSPWLVCRAQEG